MLSSTFFRRHHHYLSDIRSLHLAYHHKIMKVYLPAFNLTTTVPNVHSAALLQQGMLELLQYRGNCIKCFDEIENEEEELIDVAPSSATSNITLSSVVGVSTKNQIFASILYNTPWKDTFDQVMNNASSLEQWEVDYAHACALFCQFEFEKCTMKCVENLHKNPNDVFSLRTLFISGYFCSDTDIVATACLNMSRHYREVQKKLQSKCFLQPVITMIEGWAAYGVEESRRHSLDLAEKLAKNAIEETKELNEKFGFVGDNQQQQEKTSEECYKWWFEPEQKSPDMKDLNDSFRKAATNYDETGTVTHTGFTSVFAVHAVCHVFETKHKAKEGIAWLTDEALQQLWVPATLLAGHVWWHLGLFYFSDGDMVNAMKVYREKLGNCLNKESDPFTLSDASALLIRLHLTNQIHQERDSSSSSSSFKLNDSLLKEVEDAIKVLDSIWGQFDESEYPNKHTKLIPFFHVHKKLTELCADSSSSAASTIKKEEAKNVDVLTAENIGQELLNASTNKSKNNTSSYEQKRFMYNKMLEAREQLFNKKENDSCSAPTLNAEGFHKIITRFYALASLEGNLTIDTTENDTKNESKNENDESSSLFMMRQSTQVLFDLSAQHMGGSIAQRSLLQFYFIWIIVVGVKNGIIHKDDPVYKDLIEKIQVDGMLYGEADKYVKLLSEEVL